MTADIWQLGSAALLVVLAGLFSAADAALGGFSRARAEELKAEGRPGAVRLVKLLDDPARYLNTALLMRLLCEISAIVLVATWARDAYQGSPVPDVPHHDRRDAGRVLRRHRRRARAPSAASTT